MVSSDNLVSCLCITHQRVPMLRRAVGCFLAQTWPERELVVLHEDTDHATRDFVAKLAHPLIRTHVVPASPHITLGGKRRISIDVARGRYVATWDDDDWSAPTRLQQQIEGMRGVGQAVCTLERWIVHDQLLGQSWLSQARTWEASLVAERAVMPRYEDGERGTDRVSMDVLLAAGHVTALRAPHLYIYLYHGGNVGPRAHFKRNVFAQSTPLSPAFSRRVAALLASASEPAITPAELAAALPVT